MTEKEIQEHEQQPSSETEEAATALPVGTDEPPVTGARARRSTQKFGFDGSKKEEEEEEFSPPAGPGVKVRDMEAVAEKISHMGKKDAETIKSLYSIMYNRRFQQKNIRTIKDHILDFTGIPDADEKTHLQLQGKIGRWMRSYVQDIMDLLGVDRSKKSFDEENKPFDKDALIGRLIEWLCNPQESKNTKRKAPATAAKKKKAATATKAAAGTKRKTAATTKVPAKKAKTTATKKTKKAVEEADEEEDATESELDKADDDEDEVAGESDSDFDEDDKKSKKKPAKRVAAKKAAPRRSKKTAAVVESDGEGEDAEMAEDQPEEEEKTVPAATTDALGADVRKKVQDIIANGDAEQLTVKKIVRQLSEDMGKDFSDKKAAIKDFVTNLQM